MVEYFMSIRKKYSIIIKYTLFFASLLPTIQGTQLFFLFDLFNPLLLIMPIVMGTITGFLVGLNRYKVLQHIHDLEKAKEELSKKVEEQTKELKEKNAELHKLILLDPLTSLGNRIMLKNILQEESSKISHKYKYFSLFMIDIDYFKKYNDFYGHLEGDEVLIKIGTFLKETLKKYSAEAIRFGGEEFLVLLPNHNELQAQQVAQELIDGIYNLNIEHQKSLTTNRVTISLGICTTTSIDPQECKCIKEADTQLYYAKENGRNQYKMKK